MAGIDFKQIARLVSVRDVAEAEGLKMRGGRCVCPFHAGADGFNFAFMNDGHGHCHRCGRTADAVQFAAAIWRTDQLSAARDLNARFRLGVDETNPTAERRAVLSARETARETARKVLEAAEAEAAAAWAAVDRCQDGTPEHAEAMQRAKDADLWMRFKTIELRELEAARR